MAVERRQTDSRPKLKGPRTTRRLPTAEAERNATINAKQRGKGGYLGTHKWELTNMGAKSSLPGKNCHGSKWSCFITVTRERNAATLKGTFQMGQKPVSFWGLQGHGLAAGLTAPPQNVGFSIDVKSHAPLSWSMELSQMLRCPGLQGMNEECRMACTAYQAVLWHSKHYFMEEVSASKVLCN